MTCLFCGAPEIGGCSWPTKRFTLVKIEDLRIGDTVCRYNEDGSTRGSVATVRDLTPIQLKSTEIIVVELLIRPIHERARARQKILNVAPWGNIKALREVPCRQLVCEAHAREVHTGVFYCQQHWDAWQEAA